MWLCVCLTTHITSTNVLRVVRMHGTCHAALQAIFRPVAIAKLLYASSAWIGFTKATDRQRVDGFLRRSIRSGYCSPDTPTFAEQWLSVRLWMNNYLITFVITRITYCTVSFLHPQQPHKTTIFDRELTANNYRNILDIWLTPIL